MWKMRGKKEEEWGRYLPFEPTPRVAQPAVSQFTP